MGALLGKEGTAKASSTEVVLRERSLRPRAAVVQGSGQALGGRGAIGVVLAKRSDKRHRSVAPEPFLPYPAERPSQAPADPPEIGPPTLKHQPRDLFALAGPNSSQLAAPASQPAPELSGTVPMSRSRWASRKVFGVAEHLGDVHPLTCRAPRLTLACRQCGPHLEVSAGPAAHLVADVEGVAPQPTSTRRRTLRERQLGGEHGVDDVVHLPVVGGDVLLRLVPQVGAGQWSQHREAAVVGALGSRDPIAQAW